MTKQDRPNTKQEKFFQESPQEYTQAERGKLLACVLITLNVDPLRHFLGSRSPAGGSSARDANKPRKPATPTATASSSVGLVGVGTLQLIRFANPTTSRVCGAYLKECMRDHLPRQGARHT